MTPKMIPNSLPFWSPLASKMLQSASQKGLKKAISKQLPKNPKIEPNLGEAFHSGAPQKSSKIKPWPKMVPPGGSKGAKAAKSLPKSSLQAPKNDKKRCKMLTMIIITLPHITCMRAAALDNPSTKSGNTSLERSFVFGTPPRHNQRSHKMVRRKLHLCTPC